MILIALLFMLLVTFFIGWKAAEAVQDEVVPARKYIQTGIQLSVGALVFAILQLHLLLSWAIVAAVVVIAVLMLVRKEWLAAVLAGICVGAAVHAPAILQINMFVLSLTGNYLLGSIGKMRDAAILAGCFLGGAAVGAMLVLLL